MGPPGPAGPGGAGCACIAQMKNILQQLITRYPNSNITVKLDENGTASGRPFSITEDTIFNLTTASGAISDRVSICSIAYITLTGTDSFTGFTYLPAPSPPPVGCDAECERGVRNTLQALANAGRSADVFAGGSATGNRPVTLTAYGVAVLDNSIAVSTCKIEKIS